MAHDRSVIKGRPPRLQQIFGTNHEPLFFVTFGTLHRRTIPDLAAATEAFRAFAGKARQSYEIAVGRYVLMPDHVHLFVASGRATDFHLGRWIGGLKRAVTVSAGSPKPALLWQPGFFDHLLRSDESY